MLYPVLPVFLTQTLKASGTVVGLVDGVSQATQNVVQGFSGWLSDKLQRRKPIALVGYLLAAVSKPLIGLSHSWQAVLGARFLDRTGKGIRAAPRDALLAASVDDAHRGQAFGLEGAGDNLGAFLGPILTVVLIGALQLEIRSIFFIAIVPGLLAFLMVSLVQESRAHFASKMKLDVGPGQFSPDYWKYLLAIGVCSAGNSSNSFLILQTRNAGASLQGTILIYAAFNLVAALASYPAGQLSDRWGRRNLLAGSFAVFTITYLGFGLVGSPKVMAGLFALYGLYQGIFRSIGKAYATDFVPAHLRASGIGWFSTTIGLLELIASLVAGILWDNVSHAAVFYYGAATALVGAAMMLALLPPQPSSRQAV
jgi:MFS family permease